MTKYLLASILAFSLLRTHSQVQKIEVIPVGLTQTSRLQLNVVDGDTTAELKYMNRGVKRKNDFVTLRFKYSKEAMDLLCKEMEDATSLPKNTQRVLKLGDHFVSVKTMKQGGTKYAVLEAENKWFNINKKEVEMLFGKRKSSEKYSLVDKATRGSDRDPVRK